MVVEAGSLAMDDDVCLLPSQVAGHVSAQDGIVAVEALEETRLGGQ